MRVSNLGMSIRQSATASKAKDALVVIKAASIKAKMTTLRLAPEAVHLTLDELERAIWRFATD